eukprot:TRINITY_DN5877_c0_g1_i1.p1 TRINITY_DN5877_c0_g1~~TRINITY_DN5877_c0_g1_i1.p1  ORF type:complete len:187 (-),score=43.76 TRINITY_DN5877_c0_g1_i1:55-615(-)
MKLIVVGDSGVGKTSIITRYVENKFNIYNKASIGMEFSPKQFLIDDRIVYGQIWEMIPSGRFNENLGYFFRGADCCMIVINLADCGAFESIQKWKNEVENKIGEKEIPFIVIGNKIDLKHKRVISFEKVNKYCQINNMKYFECSAKEGINVEVAFREIMKSGLNKKLEITDFVDVNLKEENNNYCY